MATTYSFTLADTPSWLIWTTVVILFIIGHYIWLQFQKLFCMLFRHTEIPGDGFQPGFPLFPPQHRDRKSSTTNRSELEAKVVKIYDKLKESISSTEFTCRRYTQQNVQHIVSQLEELKINVLTTPTKSPPQC